MKWLKRVGLVLVAAAEAPGFRAGQAAVWTASQGR